MTRPPRLLHVTTADISLALLLGTQLRAFVDAGYEVFGASAPGEFAGELASWGVCHVALEHATRAMAPHRDLQAFAELRSRFRELRPDIVHTHNPKPGVYGRLAARAAGVPVIVNTVHGLYAQSEDPLAKRLAVYGAERLASRCSHAELVQSSEDLETLARVGVSRSKLHLLGNGVDLNRFDAERLGPDRRERARAELGLPHDEVVIGAVGRLVGEKGYRELFAAFDHLRADVPNARLLVAGPEDATKADAIPAPELQRAARSGRVRLLGLRRDMEMIYAAMDLYTLASHREGVPRSAIEASAMGLPVVATDIRGCRQVVDHGVTGLLVPAKDPCALEQALRALATDSTARSRMGAAGRARAQRDFDERDVIRRTLDVYRVLLARHGARAAA